MLDDPFNDEAPRLVGLKLLPACAVKIAAGIALLIGLAVALDAYAEDPPLHVFEGYGIVLNLHAAPCENAIARFVAARSELNGLINKLQAAKSSWRTPQGWADYAGCWVEYTFQGKAGFAVAFEDQEIVFFERSTFKKPKGATGI